MAVDYIRGPLEKNMELRLNTGYYHYRDLVFIDHPIHLMAPNNCPRAAIE